MMFSSLRKPQEQADTNMDASYTFFPDLGQLLNDVPQDSIISRTIYKDGVLKAVLFGFSEGQELSEHTASTPAIIQILSGNCRLTLGRDVFEVQAGSWAYMPANLPHSLFARGRVIMLLLLLK
jgi:quercetin dioxygenase-like cupin family protein